MAQSYPCGIGQNDYEKCGHGKKCAPIDMDGNKECLNPCATAELRKKYGLEGEGTFYQNDPDKDDFGKCVKGVGSENPQSGDGSTTGVDDSNRTNKRQNPNTNRFCLCPVDVGCGPPPPEPPVGLVFNIMWMVPNTNSKGHANRTYGEYGPPTKCTSGRYSCDRPRITVAAMWLKREDNDEICVEGACCKNGADTKKPYKVIDPRKSKKSSHEECPAGESWASCSEMALYNNENGIFQTFGPNTKGCEALEYYCETNSSCVISNAFSYGVQDLFDIGPADFGAYTAFKVTTNAPPEGETYEINVYGHTGESGGCRGRMWVHEMTKDKTNSFDVKSFYSGKPPHGGQRGRWAWSSSNNGAWYNYCANTIGGPQPKALPGQAAHMATITILPDATWIID